MAYLTLKDINKIYPNGFHAVHDFNLEIEKGEFIVFVGPSGCGKSTTLRMIAGLEDISKGDFLINGKRANEMGPRERQIAMVFQSYALYPQMSVYDNLAYGLTLQGVDEDVIEDKVKKTAKILGLTDYLDRLPRALSGGQRQRVAVGRAIIRKVGIFLMDEPLSNLDAKQRVTMRSEITQIHRETGATTIYVTHDQTEAMTLGTRIVVMKDGVVQQVDTPQNLYDMPGNLFVAGFMGSPQMNFLDATVRRDGDTAVLVVDGHDIRLPAEKSKAVLDGGYEGKDVVMGIRPEDLDDSESAIAQDSAVFTSTIKVYELLGAEVFLYFDIGGKPVTARVEASTKARPGSEIKIAMDVNKIHVFDKETEQTVTN